MTETLTVTLCTCSHSPADHIHERYMCKQGNCPCREYDEAQVYLSLDVGLPEMKRKR